MAGNTAKILQDVIIPVIRLTINPVFSCVYFSTFAQQK